MRASASVQWGRGLPDLGGRGPDERKPNRPQWRALIYVVSKHGFSAPHLRLEGKDETLEVDGFDAEGLRSALRKSLEARDIEEIRTPGGALDYDTIQRVRHVLLSGGVRLSRAWKAGE